MDVCRPEQNHHHHHHQQNSFGQIDKNLSNQLTQSNNNNNKIISKKKKLAHFFLLYHGFKSVCVYFLEVLWQRKHLMGGNNNRTSDCVHTIDKKKTETLPSISPSLALIYYSLSNKSFQLLTQTHTHIHKHKSF